MYLNKLASSIVKKYIAKNRRRQLRKRDKKICLLHKEWSRLKYGECKSINDRYACIIYKNLCGKDMEYFVSDAFFQNYLLPKLNFANYTKENRYCAGHTCFADKNYQEIFVKAIKPLNTIIRNVHGVLFNNNYEKITEQEALVLMQPYERLVYKKSTDTGHGKDVSLIYKEDYTAVIYKNDADYVIQEILKQHESLAYYNSSSVNIIRITSINWKGNVYILGGILRVGAPGAFCDHLSCNNVHPLVIPIHEDGKLGSQAIDCDQGYIYNDVFGKRIGGYILKYEEMKERIKMEHSKYPNHGIIGWDLTLDENAEIRCVEYNVRCPGIMQSQYALGAVFSQKTVNGNVLLNEILNM